MIQLDVENAKATLVLGQIGQIHFAAMPSVEEYNAALGTHNIDEVQVLSSIEAQDKPVSSSGIQEVIELQLETNPYNGKLIKKRVGKVKLQTRQ